MTQVYRIRLAVFVLVATIGGFASAQVGGGDKSSVARALASGAAVEESSVERGALYLLKDHSGILRIDGDAAVAQFNRLKVPAQRLEGVEVKVGENLVCEQALFPADRMRVLCAVIVDDASKGKIGLGSSLQVIEHKLKNAR